MKITDESKQRITTLYNGLDLSEDNVKWMSNIWLEPQFQDLRKKLLEVKKTAIIDIVSTQEELNLARLTLDGNDEVFGLFQAAFINVKSPKNEVI